MGDSLKPDPFVIGYEYYAGVQAVPCLGPVDAVDKITIGGRTAWTGNVTASQTIYIDKPELFGGEDREGGVQGYVDLDFGEASQAQNAYLQSRALTREAYDANPTFWDKIRTGGVGEFVPVEVPAYRGALSLIFRHFLWISFNPYLKKVDMRLRRIKAGWSAGAPWYPAKAEITIDGTKHMNPAHIIYQCVTDEEWGMGYPATQVDDDAFKAAADQLHSEGFGMSLRWDQQDKIERFISNVLDHINASLVTDRQTGLFKLMLIRDDYDPNTLPVFDATNITNLNQYQRKAWGETINELTIKYTDVTDGQVKTVTMQNLGNVYAQGAVVTDTQDRRGLPTADLASRVCARDLRVLSAPLATIDIDCNREAYGMEVGDPFKLSWPDIGIDNLIFRVASIDLGTLLNGRIRITATEDVFGMPNAAYTGTPPIGWTEPDRTAKPVTTQKLFEVPYYILRRRLADYEINELGPDFAFAACVARRPTRMAMNYKLWWSDTGSGSYERVSASVFTPNAQTTAAIGPMDGAVDYDNMSLGNLIRTGTYAMLGDEWIRVDQINEQTQQLTITRGVLDTVPTSHPQDTHIWLHGGGMAAADRNERITGETAHYKQQTTTGTDKLALALAAAHSITFANRYERPYPPGNLQVNNFYFPDEVVGFLTVTWTHRDRTQQLAGLVGFLDGDIGPEPGTTYELTFKQGGPNGNALYTETGITGNTWQEYQGGASVLGAYTGWIYMQLLSRRDGLTSWQAYELTFERRFITINNAESVRMTPGYVGMALTVQVEYFNYYTPPESVKLTPAYAGMTLPVQVIYENYSGPTEAVRVTPGYVGMTLT